MTTSKQPTVAVSITTHNRKDDLENTLAQLQLLDPIPDEIVIGADCCSDGTVEWVQENYPQYTLLSSETLGLSGDAGSYY